MTDEDCLAFAAFVQRSLGLDGLDIRWRPSQSPGGDPLNIAHVYAGPDLVSFHVEYDFADADDAEIRTTVVHELLHVALRHVGALVDVEKQISPYRSEILRRALEEDTERLAAAIGALLPDAEAVDG